MKRNLVLPPEIQKQSYEFLDLMEVFASLAGKQFVDPAAKRKRDAVAKKLDGLCVSLAGYYQAQAKKWQERRKEIKEEKIGK
jgi:muramidase (phage lysozyme)